MVAAARSLPSPPEMVGRWVAVLEEAGLRPRILELGDRFPEERALDVPFATLEGADTTLADMLLERPEDVLDAGQRAMRELLPMPSSEADGLRLRVTGLPSTAHRLIRGIRETDLNRFIGLDGIVRKATEVRPQIRDAVFSCLACRAEVHEPQDLLNPVLREPFECPASQGGCGRTQGRTRFRLLPEKSLYFDSQRIEIQENPETLKGGAHPQGLAVLLAEDLTGRLIPGNRVVVNGVLKSLQRGGPSRGGAGRATTFDLVLVGNSYEYKQREYDEIEVTEEEERLIQSFRGDPNVIDKVVLSLAPTIKGMEEEKEAIALQLFGGVEKRQPDGIRIRGDIHCLLVGDPGCLIGDERVTLADGTTIKLASMGSAHLQPIPHRVRLDGANDDAARATRFHRYANQPILEILTESGKAIKGTYNHPLLVWDPRSRTSTWRRLDELRVGDRLRVASRLRCWRRTLVKTGWNEPHYHHKSWHVRVPAVWDEDLAAIAGFVLGDGCVSARRVVFLAATHEAAIANQLSELFVRVFGVRPTPLPAHHGCRRYHVNRTPIARWLYTLRQHRVPDAILASPNRVAASLLRWLYEADGTCFVGGRGLTSISLRSTKLELLRDVQTLLLRWGIHGRIIWSRHALTPRTLRGYSLNGGPNGTLLIRRANSILRFARAIGFVSARKRAKLAKVVSYAESLTRRRHDDLAERIVAVRRAGRATVFDIEVPGPQRFIANGVISHNTAKSQLLRYVAEVAPRGIYTSGKGATAAGLTAAAVKDDFAGGRWMLEAGMLVLADGGIAVVDELDKMTPEDRSAMHEALEQQTVSVAKAGITATLNARCPVLAAANPKWGRFTTDRTISEQIDLPPTLLSRFDVIYSIQDRPDQARDRLLAGRILQSHQEGEARNVMVNDGTAPVYSSTSPFPPDLLRKYIAWARRNVRPVLSNEALKTLEDFYVRVRRQGEEPNAPVPITARQLEALVRLSEASARARLSPVVTTEDSERAIRIVEGFLRRVSMSEGKLDIDILASGVSHSQRERAELFQQLMHQLQADKGHFTFEELKALAEQQGIPPGRADALFAVMRSQGEVLELRPGIWQLVRF